MTIPVRRAGCALPVAVAMLLGLQGARPATAQPVPDTAAAPVADPAPDPGTQDRAAHDRAGPAGRDPLDELTPAERSRLRALLAQPVPSRRAAAAAPAPAAVPVPATASAPAKPAPVSVAPDSLAGEMLVEATALRHVLAVQGQTFLHLFGDIALTGRWLHRETVDPAARAALLDAAWRGALVVLAALAAEHLLLLAARRPLRALGRDAALAGDMAEEPPDPEDDPEFPGLIQAGPPRPGTGRITPAPQPGAVLPGSPILPTAPLPQPEALFQEPSPGSSRTAAVDPVLRAPHAEARSRDAAHRRRTVRLLRRVPFAVFRLLLKLLPLGAFLLIGNAAATLVASAPRTQLVILAVTNIYGIGRALWLGADMLLSPRAPGVRLVQVSDEAARFSLRWWSWLLAVPVVAICVTDVGRILDLPSRAGLAIQRAMVLVEHILLAVLIWRVRHRVAASLHPPRRLRRRVLGRLLFRLADSWWVVALFFDAALWFVWAAQIRGGYGKIWRLFLVSTAIIVAARLLAVALLGLLDRVFRVEPGTEQRYPGLERRAGRYYPALRRIVTGAIGIGCTVALLQSWGVPALPFFTHGTLGTHLVSAVLTVLVAALVGVLVWEGVNGALDRQIGRFNDSNQSPRAVRLQTLLPILRTLLFVVLGAVLVMTVLSEVGVNIAPLLAGAGIVGVAVGFGSQKLVQDFITGIFLLVENAMQVGDSVTVAGISGTVEHLSIRTLRLRGGDGSIQIIPFSSVTTVANMSRDFAVAAVTISIGFNENTDRVCALLGEIAAGLRADDAFAPLILADLALNGVDSLGEYAVTISGTIRCTVGGRWPVQREFNRRLRLHMTEMNIALPQAHRILDVAALPSLRGADQPGGRTVSEDASHA